MYTIGEFSGITALSVKTLRFYHEKNVLVPSTVDQVTGYRYYDSKNVETARVIKQLRELEFSLSDISQLIAEHDDADILRHIRRKRDVLRGRIEHDRELVHLLDLILKKEKEARKLMDQSNFEVVEKEVDAILVAGYRMLGRYEEISKGFSKVGSAMGFNIKGAAIGLFYDCEYKEVADYEACMPIKRIKKTEKVDVKTLPGGRAFTLLHAGPYQEIGRSYERLTQHMKKLGLAINRPTREVYLKGPGIIFKGNPKNYLTEIQMFVSA